MSEYDEGRRVGLFLAKHPNMAQYILGQHQQELEDAQANSAASTAADAIGQNPYGEMQPTMQEQAQPQPQQTVQAQQQPARQGSYGQFNDEIMLAAQATGLSPDEIYQIQQHESGGSADPANAKSPTGPVGPMQLSRAAAIDTGITPEERYDPAKNIMAGAEYYRRLKAEYGNNAHAAYYDGPGRAATGEYSPEALAYQSKFDEPVGQAYSAPKSPSGVPEEYYRGSMYRPNGMVGGEGILGQDMDPVRRSHYDAIQKLLRSKNPVLSQMGLKMLQDSQDSHLKDIERTAKEKELNLLGLDPKSSAYRRIALQSIMRPAAQTVINNGPNNRPAILTPEEQYKYIGKIAKPGEPQPRWVNGDIKTGSPLGITEDQAKAAQFATGLNSALTSIYDLSKDKDFSIEGNANDFVGSTLEDTGIPGLRSVGTSMMSDKQQMYGQAKKEAETHLVHALSGSGFTEKEEQIKTMAYLPDWGDKPGVVVAKQKALAAQLTSLVNRAGPSASPELRSAAEVAQKKANLLENKQSGNLPPLPQLPAGHKWVD